MAEGEPTKKSDSEPKKKKEWWPVVVSFLGTIPQALENGWQWFTRQSTPKVVGWSSLVFLGVVAILTFRLVERLVDQISVFGSFVTMVGFGYIFYDLYRMRNLQEVEKAAGKQTAARHHAEHYRYCLEAAEKWRTDAIGYVQRACAAYVILSVFWSLIGRGIRLQDNTR